MKQTQIMLAVGVLCTYALLLQEHEDFNILLEMVRNLDAVRENRYACIPDESREVQIAYNVECYIIKEGKTVLEVKDRK